LSPQQPGGGQTPAQKEAEEAEVKKMMKEKSSALIGQSLVHLAKICLPKCINMGETHIEKGETDCLRTCIRGLHSTHTRTFNRLVYLEQRIEKSEKEELERLEEEVRQEEIRLRE
jgi:hypothetical protein